MIEQIKAYNAFEKYQYTIPIFQRRYAWEKDEIECLLEDILNSHGDYFIGTVTVEEKENCLLLIDGQQRLTTLYLILCLICDNKSFLKNKLRFEARNNAQRILESLSTSPTTKAEEGEARENAQGILESLSTPPATTTVEGKDSSLIYGIEIIKAWFENNKINKSDFINKLKQTFFLLVSIPKGTNPNQFFETMNNRGEQLELHELVKAKILETMKDCIEERNVASEIWDAVANMNGFVFNHFSNEIKQIIFGNNNESLIPSSFFDLVNSFSNNEKEQKKLSLEEFLDKNDDTTTNYSQKKEIKDVSANLKSIISFPTFLMLTASDGKEGFSLDEKKLLDSPMSKNWETKEAAQSFIYKLLKYRLLFDKYIIKRKNGIDEDSWVLGTKIDKEGNINEQSQLDNRNLILIESCLRVTYTSPKDMHWLGQVLSELDKNEEVDIVLLLEQYASEKVKNADYKNTTGFGIQRIVFTYLDYILAKNNEEYASFSFKFRNSIEHFYPQHPVEGEYWKDEDLNSFGNLALLSVSDNSRFSNLPPMAKYEYLNSVVNQNPKLNEMAKIMNDGDKGWTQEKAKRHREEMFKQLEENLAVMM